MPATGGAELANTARQSIGCCAVVLNSLEQPFKGGTVVNAVAITGKGLDLRKSIETTNKQHGQVPPTWKWKAWLPQLTEST